MSDLQLLLLFGVVILCAILAFGMLELITCCLQPGSIRGLCPKAESETRRRRLLSIYDIYNSTTAKNDIFNVKDPNGGNNNALGRQPTNMKPGSFSRTLPSIPTIMEKNEDLDQPPSYAQVITETHVAGKVAYPGTVACDVKIV